MNPRTTLDGTHPPARPRSSLRLACLAMLLCTCQVLFASAWAAGPPIAAKGARAATSAVAELPVEAPPLPQPDELRKQLDAIPSKITEDADARTLLSQLSQISALARQIVKQRTEELADVDSRLAGLGPTPEGGSPADAPDVAEQRSTLNKQRTAVDSDLKLARLIDVDAEQRSADILRQRREQFQAALTARVDSPLSPLFWRQWKSGAYGDLLLLQELAGDLRMAIGEATSAPRKRNNFILQLLGALALLVGGTWMAERILVRVLPTRLPSGRLRRTLMAAAAVILNVLIVTLAVKLMWNGIRVNAQPDERLRMLESICVEMAAYASYVIALGHALLSNRRPSWRLLPISDHMARQLGPFPWWFALSSALGGVATKVSGLAGLSISSEVLVLIIFSLAIAAITLASLRHLRDLPAAEAAGEDGASS
ncbi:DUF3772 domain-containing protein, partial [Diaphorobacter ruginosibacter]|uniref:DUF3772 domain-containing protein n=1 Tax=Diaphorobacter ruginosibacter TaxID=1715720 RepID=UPI003342831C